MNAQRLQATLMAAALALVLAGCAGAAPATPIPAAQPTPIPAPTLVTPATAIPATAMPAPTAMPAASATATADAMMHGGMTLTVAIPATPIPATAVPATAVPAATVAPKPVAKTVDIQVFQFMPGVLEVKAGTTVIWINKDNIEHSITNGVPGKLGGKFDSGFFTQGKTFSFTFTEAGEYPYFCMRHNSMQGMVRVTP
ncbi:MAG: plastocyanin/azurin family copper-binding protein [Thermoflexales bacterium]